MANKVFKIIFYSFASLLLIYFIFSVIPGSVFSGRIDVEIVEEYSYDDYIEISGIALRNETMVTSDSPYGYLTYLLNDGERIAKGENVAYYTQNHMSSQDQNRLNEINKKISYMEDSLANKIIVDTMTLDSAAKKNIINYINAAESEELRKASDNADELHKTLIKKDIKANGSEYYQKTLTDYKEQKSNILNQMSDSEKYVKAPHAGFFTSSYDGYESIRADDYSNITMSVFNEIMEIPKTPISTTYVGKLQNSPVWYFTAAIDTEDIKTYSVADSVSLEFSLSSASSKKIKSEISYISKSEDGKSAVTFKISGLTEDEFSLRKETCKMILKTYTGLKVSNEALRVVDGQQGVYTVVGKRIVFKPISIVYTSDSFSIVTPDIKTTASRTLMAKDDVVVGGKDMFDGKVVSVD